LADSECVTALGCTSSGACSGVAESCSSQLDWFSCGELSGCYWSTSSSTCTGFTGTCSTSSSQPACNQQKGCSWVASCAGKQIATSCESQSASLCKYAAGCTLGTP